MMALRKRGGGNQRVIDLERQADGAEVASSRLLRQEDEGKQWDGCDR